MPITLSELWKFAKPARDGVSAVWERGKKIALLEARVAALEEVLNGPHPADVCKACGIRGARLAGTWIDHETGLVRQRWDCSACKMSEFRLVRPSQG